MDNNYDSDDDLLSYEPFSQSSHPSHRSSTEDCDEAHSKVEVSSTSTTMEDDVVLSVLSPADNTQSSSSSNVEVAVSSKKAKKDSDCCYDSKMVEDKGKSLYVNY